MANNIRIRYILRRNGDVITCQRGGIISHSFDINAVMKRGETASVTLVGQSKQPYNIPSSSYWLMTLLFLLGLGENPSKNML